jgi:hypothetical protein
MTAITLLQADHHGPQKSGGGIWIPLASGNAILGPFSKEF